MLIKGLFYIYLNSYFLLDIAMPRKKLGNATTISKEIQSSSNNSSTEARNSEIISQQNQSLGIFC